MIAVPILGSIINGRTCVPVTILRCSVFLRIGITISVIDSLFIRAEALFGWC
jgi:hypothetical protein